MPHNVPPRAKFSQEAAFVGQAEVLPNPLCIGPQLVYQQGRIETEFANPMAVGVQ